MKSVSLWVVFLFAAVSAQAAKVENITIEGKILSLKVPAQPAPGNPWLWVGEFGGHLGSLEDGPAISGLVKERYTLLGGSMQLVVPPGQGHNMGPGFFQCRELVTFVKAHAGPVMTLSSPLDYQVVQRTSKRRGTLTIRGEFSDSVANQHDATRTLRGSLYREYMEKLIHVSRREIRWDSPWFVAQASYHVPGEEASPDIRAAQASLWKSGLAFEGPDTDALKGEFRDDGGRGVHFSGLGLREHAARWVEKVAPWLGTKQ